MIRNTAWIGFIATILCALAVTFGLPLFFDEFGLMQMTVFVAMAVFALSQGFVWGYGGIMSFGQAAFLGLGGYAYAVAAMNMGDSTIPVLLSVMVPALFAALLGYFMFYGRISDAYVGVITLTVTVILFNLVNSTSGDAYRIGAAPLGGFNGIPAVPPLNMPGDPSSPLDPTQLWYAAGGTLILVYVVLRAILASRFRPRCRRDPGERNAGDADRVRPQALQAADIRDRRRHRGVGRVPVHQLGRLHQPDRVQPDDVRAGDHLRPGGRSGHSGRTGAGRGRNSVPDLDRRIAARGRSQCAAWHRADAVRAADPARVAAGAAQRPGAADRTAAATPTLPLSGTHPSRRHPLEHPDA